MRLLSFVDGLSGKWVSAQDKLLAPGLQALLAILATSAVLTLAIVISNRCRIPPPESQQSPCTLISRRDIVWNCPLVAVTLGVWFDDRYWTDKIASLTPNAIVSWSFSLDDTNDAGSPDSGND